MPEFVSTEQLKSRRWRHATPLSLFPKFCTAQMKSGHPPWLTCSAASKAKAHVHSMVWPRNRWGLLNEQRCQQCAALYPANRAGPPNGRGQGSFVQGAKPLLLLPMTKLHNYPDASAVTRWLQSAHHGGRPTAQ